MATVLTNVKLVAMVDIIVIILPSVFQATVTSSRLVMELGLMKLGKDIRKQVVEVFFYNFFLI